MTHEEAIEVLQQDIPCEQDTDFIEALEMAIKALSDKHKDRKKAKRFKRKYAKLKQAIFKSVKEIDKYLYANEFGSEYRADVTKIIAKNIKGADE